MKEQAAGTCSCNCSRCRKGAHCMLHFSGCHVNCKPA